MDDVLDRIAEWIVRRRWWVLGTLSLVAALFATQIPDLRADFTPSDLFATFEHQERVAREFRQAFGETDGVLLLLVEGEDVLDGNSLEYLHRLSRRARRSDRVERVESPTVSSIPRRPAPGDASAGADRSGGVGLLSALGALERFAGSSVKLGPLVQGKTVEAEEARRLREVLADSPLIEGRLVSDDRTLAAVAVVFDDSVRKNADIEAVVSNFEHWIDEHSPPDGYRVRLAGLPYVRTAVIRRMRADQTVMLPAAIGISLLLLLLAFRWLPAVALPLGAVALSTVTVVGGMAAVGEPFNVVNNIVPILVVVIGLTDAIHLIHRYGEEIAGTDDRELAARAALRQMLVACFLTSFTTAVGFGSLAVSNTEILRRFGITAAVAILLVYVATVTLVPALLPLFEPAESISTEDSADLLEEGLASAVRASLGHPLVGAALAVAPVAGVLAWNGLPDVDNAVLDQLDPQDPVYRTTQLIEEKLIGVRPLEVSFQTEKGGDLLTPAFLNRLDRLQAWAAERPPVLKTMGPTDYLHEAWYLSTGDPERRRATFPNRRMVRGLAAMFEGRGDNPLRRYLTPDHRRARLTIELKDVGARRTLAFVEQLRGRIDELFGGMESLEVEFTGDAYVGSRGLRVVIHDLMWSVGLAFVIIFGFLTLVLRDLRLGLISVPPNVFPLFAAMAYMSVRGIPINAASAVIFSVSIGLAVDGTIHLLARYREERDRRPTTRQAIAWSVRRTGRAIVLTYVALMLGFGVMLFSSFVPVRRFGELISVTVAGCLVATLVLLPPLLQLVESD